MGDHPTDRVRVLIPKSLHREPGGLPSGEHELRHGPLTLGETDLHGIEADGFLKDAGDLGEELLFAVVTQQHTAEVEKLAAKEKLRLE